ncbi:CRE-BATH-25 protein [Aphelenchoides avenae]|nr:CRE-BATH-25 protein [Aphelenchus avenae]
MKRANGEPHADGPTEKRSNHGAVGPSRPYQPSRKFRLELVIDNLKEYVGVLKGPVATVGKSGWSLRAEVKTESGSDSLAAYLHCESPEHNWRLKVDYTASVVGSAVQKVGRGVKLGQRSEHMCVFSEKKQDLLDSAKDYITDGAFKLAVDVTIYEPYRMLVDFFTADSNYNADVVLRVEDRRFHVNKAHLGYESPVFYQMFFGPYVENSCEEIALEELDSNGFLQFLGAIHLMRAPITNDTVENLVKLADRFEVDWLLRNCEEFLLGYYCNLTVVEKLILSTKVNLDELQTKCMRQLTLSDVNELIGMSKESAMRVKLDGCLLQELLGKQKELMESKHKRQKDHVVWEHKRATQVREDEHKSEMDKLKAKMCTRCRNKLS